MKKATRLHGMFCAALVWAGLAMPALAEDKVWEIKSNDTLGVIIAKTYPGYANRQAIMQELLKGSPDAFANKDINHLIVGKKLDLPDASKIPGLQPPPPIEKVDRPDAEQNFKELEARRVELEASVKSLEAENQDKNTELERLNAKLQAQQQVAEESKTQLADAQRKNDALLNDLQQARAATELAEKKASGAGSLPWILLGLLTLVTLPLLWLLWQKREQPLAVVAGLPVEGKPTERDVPQNERVVPSEAVAVSGVPLAETVPVLPEEASPAVVDESPDAELKLDIARAYMDLRDTSAAADMLQDVLLEGGSRQRQEAREILSFIA
jgi:FimV-like protein